MTSKLKVVVEYFYESQREKERETIQVYEERLYSSIKRNCNILFYIDDVTEEAEEEIDRKHTASTTKVATLSYYRRLRRRLSRWLHRRKSRGLSAWL
jgi:hypothetical protein